MVLLLLFLPFAFFLSLPHSLSYLSVSVSHNSAAVHSLRWLLMLEPSEPTIKLKNGYTFAAVYKTKPARQ